MNPLVSDPDFTLHVGDVRDVLREFEPESVHCVVTSPPYWGLRDYGTGEWEGGDPECDHRNETHIAGDPTSTLGVPAGGGKRRIGEANETRQVNGVYGAVCGKCGATRIDRQLGLEPTPEEYVANMVEVFREVRRVVRSDGTCWVNLGDSYAHSLRQSGTAHAGGKQNTNEGSMRQGFKPIPGGMKEKDLVGIPWRVAFALQADGWYLRSDIIWSKPNPMPESVTDRPTKAHEYLFLLTKSPRYFFDQEAVREPHQGIERPRWDGAPPPDGTGAALRNGTGMTNHNHRAGNTPGGRNIRSVWEIATQPYPEAHFATFPQALVEPCIKAGTSERGCCPECGAPWVRETERGSLDATRPQARRALDLAAEHGLTEEHITAIRSAGVTDAGKAQVTQDGFGKNTADVIALAEYAKDKLGGYYREFLLARPTTTGWTPSCSHAAQPAACTVADIFLGSGTTALVARNLGRKCIGIELSPEYAALAARRLQQLSLLA